MPVRGLKQRLSLEGGTKQNFAFSKIQKREHFAHRKQPKLPAICTPNEVVGGPFSGGVSWQGLTTGMGDWKICLGVNPLEVPH